MAESERADLARVYRAIGNSKAPMPIRVHAIGDRLALRFADGDEAAVRAWATATGGTIGRSPAEGGFHDFGTTYDCGGATGFWLGWEITLRTTIAGERPDAEVVLGTGDEPADEAIVPNAGSTS